MIAKPREKLGRLRNRDWSKRKRIEKKQRNKSALQRLKSLKRMLSVSRWSNLKSCKVRSMTSLRALILSSLRLKLVSLLFLTLQRRATRINH